MNKKDLQKTLKLLMDLRQEDKQGQHITDKMVNSSYYGDYYEYYVNDYKNETRGEVALWRAVLLQAFIDLKTKSKKHVKKPVKREAAKWFRTNKRDLMDVCALADYDYRMVAKKAEEILADNSARVCLKKRI